MTSAKWFNSLKYHRWAALVAVLFTLLAVIYSLASPPFEISDEARHYAVVKYMADTGQLPVQEPGEAQRHWSHEGNQPPLYYGLAALLTARIDTGAWNDVYWYNPHTSVGVPLRADNENMNIHTAGESFPWRGYTLAVHLIRFLSVAMGLVTVVFTYRIGLLLFNGRRDWAVLAMAIAAFTPMFIFISGGVNNDNLVVMFCTLATWLLVKMAQNGSTWKQSVWLGVLIGLGALSKLYALGMLPLAGLLFAAQFIRDKNWKKFLLNGSLVVLAVALTAGWWYARNAFLYGDPLALAPMRDVAGERDTPLTLPIFLAEFEGFRIAYWALFGGVNVIAARWIYQLLDWVTLAAVIGGLILPARRLFYRRFSLSSRLNPAALAVLLGWVGIMVGGFAVWNFTQPASQGRLFYPAIASLSALAVVGLGAYLPGRWANRLPAALAAGLFLFAALSPWVYIIPAYTKPPLLTPADIPANLPRLDYTFNGQISLVAVEIPAEPVRAAQTLPVKVYWQVLSPMPVNYSVFIHLYGRENRLMGQLDTYPGLGAWPTTLLKPGDVLADTYLIPVQVAAEENAPARLNVAVGLYEYEQPGYPRPPVVNAAGDPLETPLVGQAKLIPWNWPATAPQNSLAVQFDDGIALNGYDSTCSVTSGPCRLTLYWAASATPAADYQVFAQLWRGQEQIGGFDGPPVNGDYPTRLWAAGETIVDAHTLALPANLPPGDYRLRVGLYRLDNGVRLPAYVSGAPLPDFAVDIPLPEN